MSALYDIFKKALGQPIDDNGQYQFYFMQEYESIDIIWGSDTKIKFLSPNEKDDVNIQRCKKS